MSIKKLMIKIMDWVMLDCRQATLLITKKLEDEITFIENLRLKLHLMNCNFCNTFNLQSKKIDELLKQNPDDLQQKCTHHHKMNKQKKEKIIKKLNKYLDNQ